MTAVDDKRTHARSGLLIGLGFYLTLAIVSFAGWVTYFGLWSRSWAVPLVYGSDALSGGAAFKGTIENGWYERNPSIGAPHGQVLHAFPLADNMQFVVARILGLFTHEWSVVYNLAYLLTFPSAAVAGAWFIRKCGGSMLVAATFGILFSAAPYRFSHGLPHLSLSMYFTVPLVAWLAVATMTGHPIWRRRPGGHRLSPLRWVTSLTVGTLAIAVLVGTTSSYYAVFGLIFLGVATVVTLVNGRWRDACAAVSAGVAIVVVLVTNMAPDILWQRSQLASPADFGREPFESEQFAFKFVALVFPTPWNRLGDLGAWRRSYDATFPLPSEPVALGLIATVGFVALLALPLAVLARGRRPTGWWPGPRVSSMSLLAWAGLAFGAVGGLATVFALLLTPSIRAWNRIAIFLILFGLSAAALGLDRVTAALRRRVQRGRDAPRQRGLAQVTAPALALVVLALGLWDQVPPSNWGQVGDAEERWANDQDYVAEIEARVPSGTMVFELPATPYPESPPMHAMEDYELYRPYLHSHDLRWSYGAVKGKPSGDWSTIAAGMPIERLVVALGAAGFGGIHVDRRGYPDAASSLESSLDDLLGTEPIVSPDGQFLFYDMSDFVTELKRDRSPKWLDRVGSHLVRQPTPYWQQDFNAPTPGADGQLVMAGKNASPDLDILNPRRQPTTMMISFTVRAEGVSEPTAVRIAWPDGTTDEMLVDTSGKPVQRRLEVPPGASAIAFQAPGASAVSLVGAAMEDPVLRFSVNSEWDRR